MGDCQLLKTDAFQTLFLYKQTAILFSFEAN